MEVHAQVASNAKLFSGASTQFGNEPNSNVAFVDAAMPGMLPVINEFCVEQAVRTGLGLKADINCGLHLIVKTISILTCRRISRNFITRLWAKAKSSLTWAQVLRAVRIERIHMEQDAANRLRLTQTCHW